MNDTSSETNCDNKSSPSNLPLLSQTAVITNGIMNRERRIRLFPIEKHSRCLSTKEPVIFLKFSVVLSRSNKPCDKVARSRTAL